MSGGYWNYKNNDLMNEVFGYFYDRKDGKIAVPNAFEDKVLSEMVWDVLVMMKDFDLYKSGDTSEETWLRKKQEFKGKWLSKNKDELYKGIIDKSLKELRDELYQSIGIKEDAPFVSKNTD